MVYAFDNGLPLPQRTIIREGAVALLSGLLRSNGGFLQAVEAYGGIVRGYTDNDGIDAVWEALNGRAPALLIATGDRQSSPDGMGGFSFHGPIELVIYVYNNHGRGLTLGRMRPDAAALASPTADPGVDVMMQITEELIVGQRAGVANDAAGASIKQIVPRLEEELRTENNLTLWVQRYSVETKRLINRNRGVTEILNAWQTLTRASETPTLDPPAPPVAGADSTRT